jgi:diguanylate cyclase
MLNRISVNLSPLQMMDPVFSKHVLTTLERYGLHPKRLCLEVKDTEAMHDAETSSLLFNELSRHGVKIALDDFGAGDSSLVSLQQLPVTNIKLNRLFIGRLQRSKKDAAVVRSIIALAHSLGLEVVAEGVETGEELNWLKRMNCDLMQGFLIDQPLPADQFTKKYLRKIVVN